jgi:hypothetical protein
MGMFDDPLPPAMRNALAARLQPEVPWRLDDLLAPRSQSSTAVESDPTGPNVGGLDIAPPSLAGVPRLGMTLASDNGATSYSGQLAFVDPRQGLLQLLLGQASGVGAPDTGGSRWTQIAQTEAGEPPLRRLHPDSTYESDPTARRSYEYWKDQPTEAIVESLKPGTNNSRSLKVKPDGTEVDGNTRVRVLEDRGIDIDALPREALPGDATEPDAGSATRRRSVPKPKVPPLRGRSTE